MDGEVEAEKQNINNLEEYDRNIPNWHEKLSFALLSYELSSILQLGQLYNYSMEEVLPIEVKVPSSWIPIETELEEADGPFLNVLNWTQMKGKGL